MREFARSRNCLVTFGFLAMLTPYCQLKGVSSPRLETQQEMNSLGSARKEISSVILKTIERSKSRTAEGVEVQTMPLHPSNSDIQDVKKYGDAAVEALSSYARIHDPLQQHVALGLLAHFQSDTALAAVRAFADSSNPQAIRLQALAALAGFPTEKAQAPLERHCGNDHDPAVRKRACELLKRAPTTDQ